MSKTDPNIRITRVELYELDPGPLPHPFADATMGPFTHWKIFWMRLTADDGVVGEAIASADTHNVLPGLLGGKPQSLDERWHQLYWALRNAGHRSPSVTGMLAAIDMAMRDILAKRAGQPWHRYNGAKRDSVPVYASGGGVNLSSDELVEQALAAQQDGYDTFKMKVGTDFGKRVEDDVKRVAAVRKAIGRDMRLAVDSNQCWDAKSAIAFAERIESYNIAWFEEPVHATDRKAISDVAEFSPISVSFGESEADCLAFCDLAERNVQHLQPAPSKLPGFRQWKQAVGYAEADGRTWSSGGMTPITAMFVATREGGMVEYLRPIIAHLTTCFAVKPDEPVGGQLHLPSNRPGLPVEIDWTGLRSRNAIRCHLDAKLRRT